VAAVRHEAGADAHRVGHLTHVDVAVRIDTDVVRADEVARRAAVHLAPARQHRARPVVDAHPAGPLVGDRAEARRLVAGAVQQLGDVDQPVAIDGDVGRALHVVPLVQIVAVRAEELDAVVLAVGDQHAAVRRHRDAVDEVELPRPGARLAP